MIDFSELLNYENFEAFCADLFFEKGLHVRRLGRGPGQVGKDVIIQERVSGPLSDREYRKWLVECKYTERSGSISEKDIFNVVDRVKSQNAYGYILFTNARLSVNLEKTLTGLKNRGEIGVDIWIKEKIINNTILCENIFRKYFPESYMKVLQGNRLLVLKQVRSYKSPLVNVLSHLKLIKDFEKMPISNNRMNDNILYMINELEAMLNKIDEDLTSIQSEYECQL